jgi:hypothetical protein
MKRFAYRTALAASLVLAAGTSTATGSIRPDDRATHGQGAVILVEQRDDAVRPDDRATHGQGAITGEQPNNVVRPDDRPYHGPGAVELGQLNRIEQVPVIALGGSEAERVDGFDWLDAGIGAAAALGLGLVIAGSVVFVLRRAQAPAYS